MDFVLFDQKWIKFLRRIWIFKFIPFVDFSLAAGSMAMGNVRSESDFDVIIGARSGRIFTARFFSVLAFGLFGWRRKKWHGQAKLKISRHRFNNFSEDGIPLAAGKVSSVRDKVCLNHFITEKSYRLAEPHNEYWQELYRNLVPIYGEQAKIQQFWQANLEWVTDPNFHYKYENFHYKSYSFYNGSFRSSQDDLRYIYRKPSVLTKVAKAILEGKVGDWLESILKRIQVKKIESGLAKQSGYKPRIVYTDQELEFHPDTRRIEDFLK